jgi:8-oxo-dGTP diphosphatase
MKIIYYGTSNKAKIDYMQQMVRKLPIQIIGIRTLANIKHNIIESGKTPLENAEIKAAYYYSQISMPVFSCDTGLYFKGVKEREQPGIHVRRVNGKELTDDEMTGYYAKLAEKYGGSLIAFYENAISIVIDKNTKLNFKGGDINSAEFIICSKAYNKRNEGFPLDPLSKDIRTGKYYYELPEHRYDEDIGKGWLKIFNNIIDKI